MSTRSCSRPSLSLLASAIRKTATWHLLLLHLSTVTIRTALLLRHINRIKRHSRNLEWRHNWDTISITTISTTTLRLRDTLHLHLTLRLHANGNRMRSNLLMFHTSSKCNSALCIITIRIIQAAVFLTAEQKERLSFRLLVCILLIPPLSSIITPLAWYQYNSSQHPHITRTDTQW